MRIYPLLAAALISSAVACNSGTGAASTDSVAVKSADSPSMAHDSMSTMHHDLASDIPPVPGVPAGAKVFFKNLKDGQTISSPFTVEFGVEGIRLDTAGPVVAGSGHHHLLIDSEDSLASGTVVMKDDKHLHFGKAQTQSVVTLTPGKHKLTLQYADGVHRSYGGSLSKTIGVTVK